MMETTMGLPESGVMVCHWCQVDDDRELMVHSHIRNAEGKPVRPHRYTHHDCAEVVERIANL